MNPLKILYGVEVSLRAARVIGVTLLLGVAFALMIMPAPAHAEISVGQAFGGWKEYIDAVVSSVIFAVIGVGVALLKKYTGIQIEDSRRQALQTAAANAAGKVLVILDNKMENLKLTTGNPALDAGVQYVLDKSPQAVAYFGLTPDKIRELIIAKLPQVANSTTAASAPAA